MPLKPQCLIYTNTHEFCVAKLFFEEAKLKIVVLPLIVDKLVVLEYYKPPNVFTATHWYFQLLTKLLVMIILA